MKERILIVDDNRAAADTLALLIRALGYETRAVYTGAAAIEQISAFNPDMALIDIGMPGADGYETVARIREQEDGKHIILVAVTGWSRGEDKQRAYESGFDLHVTKPMQLDTLRELLALVDPEANAPGSAVLLESA